MKHWVDLQKLPNNFKEFIDNFLKEIEQIGFLYFFPIEQKIQPGIALGDQKKFDLDCFKEKLKLDDVEYIIRVALCQTKYHVKIFYEGYPQTERKEFYYTLQVLSNEVLLKEDRKKNPLKYLIKEMATTPDF